MKIHPLRFGVSFHPLLPSFSFQYSLKRVNKLAPFCLLCHTKTAICTHNIISNPPAVNTINRHNVFTCTFIFGREVPI